MTKHSTLVSVLCLLLVTTVNAATVGYTNPCEELGTATILNELYYDLSAMENGGCPPPPSSSPSLKSPSFSCSGMFYHGMDPWAGTVVSGVFIQRDGGIQMPGKYEALTSSNFSMGIETLMSAVCPAKITNEGEYPVWCPTEVAIAEGGVSFSYLRSDLKLPQSLFTEWNTTGTVASYANYTGAVIPIWDGPGMILVPEMAANPNIELPASSSSSFWDDRVGSSWPHDGGSAGRINCGNGIDTYALKLNLDELPTAIVPDDVIMQCPPKTSSGWQEKYAVPTGWENYCPEYNTSEEYYTLLTERISKLQSNHDAGYYSMNSMYDQNVSSLYPETQALASLYNASTAQYLAGMVLKNYPTSLACGIPPEKFDSVFIPAFTYENWPKERESYFVSSGTQPFRPETVLSSWEGMGFNELAKYLVFTGDGQTAGSEEDALRYAEEFYEASQVGGGAPISIPVVYINDAALFFNDEDDDGTTNIDSKPDLFRCAKSTRSMMESDENTAAIVSNDTDTSASDDIGSSSESSSTAIALSSIARILAAMGVVALL